MITLESLLQSLRIQAAELTLQSSVDRDAWSFLMDVFDLGLLLEAVPSRRGEIRGFLDETAVQLDYQIGLIRRFIFDIHSRSSFGWSDDPSQWEDLCTRRSAVAFFAELYEETALGPNVLSIEQAALDELMRDRSCHAFLQPGAIPAHMPTRHWWWWLPDDPPA
jgi:hypothetical protein